MNATQAVEEFRSLIKSAGFEDAGTVTAEEHEDGIGAGVGHNWFRNGVWYTDAETANEVGKGIALFNKRGEQKEVFKSSRAVFSVASRHEEMNHIFSFEIVNL